MIIGFNQLVEWRSALDRHHAPPALGILRAPVRLVVTNGCFDLLHAGHVEYLERARQEGDFLLVGVNSDEGVRELKGAGRPLNGEWERAAVLLGLRAVNAVCVFPGRSAAEFLMAARPNVYVKGGDYRVPGTRGTERELDASEYRVLQLVGARVVIKPLRPGLSTTELVRKIVLTNNPG